MIMAPTNNASKTNILRCGYSVKYFTNGQLNRLLIRIGPQIMTPIQYRSVPIDFTVLATLWREID